MSSEQPRKASDIILGLEAKVDQLIELNKILDFNYKVMSNKLNDIVAILSMQSTNGMASNDTKFVPLPSVESFVDMNATATITAPTSSTLPIQNGPQQSYGRTSRSETFENVAATPTMQKVVTTPTISEPSVIKVPKIIQRQEPMSAPVNTAKQEETMASRGMSTKLPDRINTDAKIAVSQRVVNKNGKAVFLANIDIVEKNTKEIIGKTRTNSVGKWSYAIPIGEYNIVLRKIDVDTKELSEITQNLIVDGAENPLDLTPVIIK